VKMIVNVMAPEVTMFTNKLLIIINTNISAVRTSEVGEAIAQCNEVSWNFVWYG